VGLCIFGVGCETCLIASNTRLYCSPNEPYTALQLT
jgi:hypothetical protein